MLIHSVSILTWFYKQHIRVLYMPVTMVLHPRSIKVPILGNLCNALVCLWLVRLSLVFLFGKSGKSEHHFLPLQAFFTRNVFCFRRVRNDVLQTTFNRCSWKQIRITCTITGHPRNSLHTSHFQPDCHKALGVFRDVHSHSHLGIRGLDNTFVPEYRVKVSKDPG